MCTFCHIARRKIILRWIEITQVGWLQGTQGWEIYQASTIGQGLFIIAIELVGSATTKCLAILISRNSTDSMLLGKSLVVSSLDTESEIITLVRLDSHQTSIRYVMLALITEQVVVMTDNIAISFKHLLASSWNILILEHTTQFQSINRL